MRRAILPVVLGLLGAALFLTSVALAAPSQPAALPVTGGRFQLEDPITDTVAADGGMAHAAALSP